MRTEEEIRNKIDILQQIINKEYKKDTPDQDIVDACMERTDELYWVLEYYDL